MRIRIVALGLLTALPGFLVGGCGNSTPEQGAVATNQPVQAAAPTVAPAPPIPVAQVRWLGMRQIATETNAAYFTNLWNLPESRRLKDQTLDKFSLALFATNLHLADRVHARGTDNSSPITNYQAIVAQDRLASLVRPLLDDLVQEEWCLDIEQVTNRPASWALAVRLSTPQAETWQAAAEKVATEIGRPAGLARGTNGAADYQPAPRRFHLSRIGDWTVVMLDPGAAENAAAKQLIARIQRDGNLFASRGTNYWLQCELNVPALAALAGVNFASLPEPRPATLALTAVGEGINVRTRGQVEFQAPLTSVLEPWNMPTNLIGQPMSSFTAVRGFQPWLESSGLWSGLHAGPPPNQLFVWGMQGLAMETFFAAPLVDASNQVDKISSLVLQKGEPWFATNNSAKFVRSEAFNGLQWKGVPLLAPFLASFNTNGIDMALGGMAPYSDPKFPLPPELLRELDQTNLLAYAWEVTPARIEQWIYISQFFRMITRRSQLPGPSASLRWLKVAGPKLGGCISEISQTGSNRLSVIRKSTMGLSAVELHLMADWLESPDFPFGLLTLLVPANPEEIGEVPPAGTGQ